jgi:hypothetical protein
VKIRRPFSGPAALAAALAILLPAASRAAAPVARLVSVEEIKPQGRLSHFRGAGLSAFDEEPSMGDAGFSVRWYAAPPGAPEGTLLYAECMFDRSQMPRTFFAPQREATEGYRTSEITVPGAMIARYGRIVCWQVTLSYRGTVVDRWVSEAGWTPVGELPQVGMDAAASARRAALPAPEAAPVHVRQRMSVLPGAEPVRQAPVAVPAAPARPVPPPVRQPATKPAGHVLPQPAAPAARPVQPAGRPATSPAVAPAPARPAAKPVVSPSVPTVPRRPVDPNAPVGWSPASRSATSAKPVSAKPVASQPVAPKPVAAKPAPPKPVPVKPASAQPVGRPVGIRPSTPDAQPAPRSLP